MEGASRRVLIVDDHRSFAEALAVVVEAEPDLHCVGIAGTAAEAVAAARATKPDVAVVDLRLPDGSGTTLGCRLREEAPALAVVALTAYADATSLAAAAEAGVAAFLPKECALGEIVASVRDAGSGHLVIDAMTLGRVLDGRRPSSRIVAEVDGVQVTPRELEVLALLAEALDAQGIAKRLGISIHTSRGHLKSLLAKFGVHTQLELVVRALRLGLLPDIAGPRTGPVPALAAAAV